MTDPESFVPLDSDTVKALDRFRVNEIKTYEDAINFLIRRYYRTILIPELGIYAYDPP